MYFCREITHFCHRIHNMIFRKWGGGLKTAWNFFDYSSVLVGKWALAGFSYSQFGPKVDINSCLFQKNMPTASIWLKVWLQEDLIFWQCNTKYKRWYNFCFVGSVSDPLVCSRKVLCEKKMCQNKQKSSQGEGLDWGGHFFAEPLSDFLLRRSHLASRGNFFTFSFHGASLNCPNWPKLD